MIPIPSICAVFFTTVRVLTRLLEQAPYVWNAGLKFTHSVASGDPWADSVLLWTRAVPLTRDTPSNPSNTPLLPDQSIPACVRYEIATDNNLQLVVNSGTAFTSADVDWTVKVSAQVVCR